MDVKLVVLHPLTEGTTASHFKVMPWGDLPEALAPVLCLGALHLVSQVKCVARGRNAGSISYMGKTHTRNEMKPSTQLAYTLSQPVFLLLSVLQASVKTLSCCHGQRPSGLDVPPHGHTPLCAQAPAGCLGSSEKARTECRLLHVSLEDSGSTNSRQRIRPT